MGQGSGGMLIADAATLSQLQALVQQQQAVQGWHNASHLLQALHVQQQLQQSSSGGPVGALACLLCLAAMTVPNSDQLWPEAAL